MIDISELVKQSINFDTLVAEVQSRVDQLKTQEVQNVQEQVEAPFNQKIKHFKNYMKQCITQLNSARIASKMLSNNYISNEWTTQLDQMAQTLKIKNTNEESFKQEAIELISTRYLQNNKNETINYINRQRLSEETFQSLYKSQALITSISNFAFQDSREPVKFTVVIGNVTKVGIAELGLNDIFKASSFELSPSGINIRLNAIAGDINKVLNQLAIGQELDFTSQRKSTLFQNLKLLDITSEYYQAYTSLMNVQDFLLSYLSQTKEKASINYGHIGEALAHAYYESNPEKNINNKLFIAKLIENSLGNTNAAKAGDVKQIKNEIEQHFLVKSLITTKAHIKEEYINNKGEAKQRWQDSTSTHADITTIEYAINTLTNLYSAIPDNVGNSANLQQILQNTINNMPEHSVSEISQQIKMAIDNVL